MRFWGAFVGMVLSACSQLVIAPAQVRVVITPPISTAGLDSSRCYAIHVSGDHRDLKQDEFAGGQCREGASGVGLYSGLHSVGDEVTLTVPAGPKRRIDLLSLPKPESGCSRDFQLQATAPGVFVARVQGAISSEAPKLVATNTVDIVPGPQTVALQSLDPGSVLASQNYTCTGAPKITTAKRLANGSLEIKGSDLDSVDQVRIEGGSTIPLSIVSKSWDTLVARTQSAASVVLGGAYSLVVTSAFGQATTSLNVELSPGSVRPEHLDLSLDWPFPTPRTLLRDDINSNPGVTTVTSGTLDLLTDNNTTTFADFALLSSGCSNDVTDPSFAGRYIFKIGNGVQPLSGSLLAYSYTDSSMGTPQFESAGSLSDAIAGITSPAGMIPWGTTPAWQQFNFFNATHLILRLACASNPGRFAKFYELRVNAYPTN